MWGMWLSQLLSVGTSGCVTVPTQVSRVLFVHERPQQQGIGPILHQALQNPMSSLPANWTHVVVFKTPIQHHVSKLFHAHFVPDIRTETAFWLVPWPRCMERWQLCSVMNLCSVLPQITIVSPRTDNQSMKTNVVERLPCIYCMYVCVLCLNAFWSTYLP